MITSCVVKSLNPFYTKKSVSFDERFLGNWDDGKKGKWKIIAFKDEITKDNPVNKMKKDDLKLYEIYKESFYILREFRDKETVYLATPFIVKGETFLDFIPLDFQEEIDNLLNRHTIYTHSLVKYNVKENGNIEIKWLDEDKIESLFKQKKIKIKHEKVGALKDKYLLTASSENLEKFVEKYISSKDDEKWNTSTKYTLKKVDEFK